MAENLKDISSREDIELLVHNFYEKVKQDELIGPVFHRLGPEFWDYHTPIMVEFWSGILLHVGNYPGGLIWKHIMIDKQTPLEPEHFARWKKLFTEALYSTFKGSVADEAMTRVKVVEQVMMAKIKASRNPGFIQ
ncbi:MAG: group III truncated hemoglobin [Bacteroidia bacterium]|nr:group III truncated hemoglobin [Bacteroidia bacterium]